MFDHDLYKNDEPQALLLRTIICQRSNNGGDDPGILLWWWIAAVIVSFISLLGLCYAIGWALVYFGLQDYTPLTISFLCLPVVWAGIDNL